MEHTALPWHVGTRGDVFASNGEQIATTIWRLVVPVDANALYIVRACNNFPQLVAALTEITDRFERLERLYFEAAQQEPDGENGSVVRARAALREAKGEQ